MDLGERSPTPATLQKTVGSASHAPSVSRAASSELRRWQPSCRSFLGSTSLTLPLRRSIEGPFGGLRTLGACGSSPLTHAPTPSKIFRHHAAVPSHCWPLAGCETNFTTHWTEPTDLICARQARGLKSNSCKRESKGEREGISRQGDGHPRCLPPGRG